MEVEQVAVAAALDPGSERLQRRLGIVADDLRDPRVVREERGEDGLGDEGDGGVRMAFPDSPNQRRGQEHVAHRTQSDHQDAGRHEGWEDNVLLGLLHG